jgi:hypothetical protein
MARGGKTKALAGLLKQMFAELQKSSPGEIEMFLLVAPTLVIGGWLKHEILRQLDDEPPVMLKQQLRVVSALEPSERLRGFYPGRHAIIVYQPYEFSKDWRNELDALRRYKMPFAELPEHVMREGC